MSDHEPAAAGRRAAPTSEPEPDDGPVLGPGSAAEAIHASQDAIGLLDADLTVLAWNAAAERLYGIPAADAVGVNLRKSLSVEMPGQPDVVGRIIRPTLARTGFWSGRIVQRIQRGPLAGTELIVDTTTIFVHDPDQPAPRMLVTNRDVTASARLEAEMAALATLVAATGRARSVAEVADAALDIVGRAIGADAGAVISAEGTYEAIAAHGLRPETIRAIEASGEPDAAVVDALRSPDAFISGDVDTVSLPEDVRAAIAADGLRHLMVFGLHVSGELIGAIALGWRREVRTEPSTAVLRQSAALIAAALENARLIAIVERGLEEERLLTRRMRALVELTRLPTVAPAEERPLDGLLAEINAVIGAAGSVLGQVEGDHLRPIAVANLDPARIEPLMARPLSTLPVAASLIAGGHSVLLPITSATVTTAGSRTAVEDGFRSVAAFAIREEDRLVGIVYSVFRETVDELELDTRTLDAIGRVLDISFANRRLREGAEASERRYRELFEASPDALVVQSLDRVVLDANPAARRLYGDDLIGHSVDELVSDDEDTTTVDEDGVAHYTGIGHRLDGSTFPEEVDVRRIELDGEPRMLAIVRDLTDRSRLQAELVQAQKMDAIGLLVAGVAHELNNPLASIVAFSQLIRSDPRLPPDLRTQADLLVQEANRTRTIVGNLLDFARQRPPERVETELRPLVDSVLGLQSYLLTRDRLTVEIDIPADLPTLSVDRSQFQQVLVNLTVNAAQAVREAGRPGRLTIRARVEGRNAGRVVRITIADDGPGIPAEVLDRLFMPFVTTKPPGSGTGLGLSVSFGIVAAHGGSIHHEPNADGGATFVIELPVGRPAPADGPPADASDGSDGSNGSGDAAVGTADDLALDDLRRRDDAGATTGPRILVLDDEPAIREFLARVLSRSGYEPVLASTGVAALDIVRSDPPTAILCDHRMAGMTGTEFHALVVEIDPSLGRRFAFMSGDVLNPELRDFATARGVQLLAKPFDIATVDATVRALVLAPEG